MKNKALTFSIFGLLLTLAVSIALPTVLSAVGLAPTQNPTVGATYVTLCGILVVVMIVEIVSVYKIDDSTFHTALLAGSLVALYAFSVDMQLFFSGFGMEISKAIFGIASEIAFVFVLSCCCWFMLYTYDLRVDGTNLAYVTVPSVVALLVYSITVMMGYGYIAHFVIAVIFAGAFFRILFRAGKKTKIGITTYFTAAIFCLSVGVQSANALYYNGATVAVPGLTLAYATLTVAMFGSVYLAFCIRTDLKAVRSSQYKHQAELFETKALSGQIKPHFIFNSLEAVRSLYHKDIASGDVALNLLSNFLRGSIDSFDSELVPFETEIDNIFSYTEFENLKRENKIEVIFDIDFTEFCVPPFSLQPFVENALKYSGVGEKENGKIIISSYRKGETAVVEISDNGKGFDVAKVPNTSHGIRNACGRFALALNTVPTIESVEGKGTHIKIVIDLTNQQGKKS